MTRKQRRGILIGSGVAILTVAALLVMSALKDSVVFFHTPSDVSEKKIAAGERFRLGGLVAAGTVKRGEGTAVTFAVTDTLQTIPVSFTGVLPDLFREGQGVVAEGKLTADGQFIADSVLAKHDENYMPPEVAKSLEARGVKLGTGAHPAGAAGSDPAAKADAPAATSPAAVPSAGSTSETTNSDAPKAE